MVAGVSRTTGQPVHRTYVRLGAYANLLGPLAFYALAWRAFGGTAAAAATFGFVFCRDVWAPAWVTAAYSPWLFPMTFAQGLFYLAILAYRFGADSGRAVAFAICGLASGLTLLSHTAPALVFVGAVVAVALAEAAWPRTPAAGGRGPGLRRYGLLFGTMAAVAGPFLYSIVGRYHLRVRNPVPLRWEWPGLRNLAAFLAQQASMPALIAAAGIGVLAWRWRRSLDARIVLAWIAATLAPLAYRLAANRFDWPRLLPSHHFVFYAKAAQWLLVGLAASLALGGLRRLLGRLPARWSRPVAPDGLALGLVVALALPLALPQYATRGYFGAARAGGLRVEANEAERAAYRWIRERTSPDDVFLAPAELALRVVGPAGRKVVVASVLHSNPYVDWQSRSRFAAWMFRALLEGDERAFLSLARAFGVTYIVTTPQLHPGLGPLVRSGRMASLVPCFEGVRDAGRRAVRVYGVRASGAALPCREAP